MKVAMTEPDLTNREDPNLQADPVLCLSDDTRATFGQKLFAGVVAIVVVLGTLYGLLYQGGEMSRHSTPLAVSGAVPPSTVGQSN